MRTLLRFRADLWFRRPHIGLVHGRCSGTPKGKLLSPRADLWCQRHCTGLVDDIIRFAAGPPAWFAGQSTSNQVASFLIAVPASNRDELGKHSGPGSADVLTQRARPPAVPPAPSPSHGARLAGQPTCTRQGARAVELGQGRMHRAPSPSFHASMIACCFFANIHLGLARDVWSIEKARRE